jgi:hypothetical protein
MKFRITRSDSRQTSLTLVYRPQEFSFDVEPSPGRGWTSILVDDLNLELDEAGKVISVWGLCPHTRWQQARLTPPDADFGDVVAVSDVPLSRGASVRLNHDTYLPVHVDPESGWIRIRGDCIPASSVKLLAGVILEFTEAGDFCALWLMTR